MIKKALNDTYFINLIKVFMQSPFLEGAYFRIFKYYSTNGDFALEQEVVEKNHLWIK